MPKVGTSPPIHVLDGGLLLVIITMGGMRTHCEDPLLPGRAQPETWTVGEVEIVGEQSRGQGRASTEATDRKAAGATGSFTGDAATDQEAVKRRLSELHRLLNSRKVSLNATYRKNAKANTTSTKSQQQALDALAKEYVDF